MELLGTIIILQLKCMENYSNLLLGLYDNASHCSLDEFHDSAISILKKELYFDSATVISASKINEVGISANSIFAYGQPIEKLHDHKKLVSPDLVLAEALIKRGEVISARVEDKVKGFPDIQKYAKKYAVAQSLVMIPKAEGPNDLNIFAAWRSDRRKEYLAQDRYFGRLIIPHIFKALNINTRLFSSSTHEPASGIPIISNLVGQLYFVEEVANKILQAEWPEWAPPILPFHMIQELQSNKKLIFSGNTFSAKAVKHGDLLSIQLYPKQDNDLTKTEKKVALFASYGLTYKEIAKELGTSPATIRNQLQSIYRKLNIKNKTMLLPIQSSLKK